MSPKNGYFVLLGTFLLVLIAGSTAYYFADRYLASQADKIARLKAESEIVDLKISSARSAQADLQRYDFITDIATEVLPPDKVQSDLVAELVRFAENSGVELVRVSFQSSGDGANATSQTVPIPGVNGINSLPISLNIEGSYENTLKFLEEIETNRRKMQIGSVGISPIETANQYNSGIELNVYVKVN